MLKIDNTNLNTGTYFEKFEIYCSNCIRWRCHVIASFRWLGDVMCKYVAVSACFY